MHEAKTLFTKKKKELNDIIMQCRVGTQKLIIGIQNNICGIFFFWGYHIFGSKKVLFEEAPEKYFLLKHFSEIIIIIIIKRQVYSRAYSTEA